MEQAAASQQAGTARRGIGPGMRAFLHAAVNMLGRIGMYTIPCVEDEATMHFFLTLDRMDWQA